MANPTNSVDIHDLSYATTHALLLAKKNDATGRESTEAQQAEICGEHWGDFQDDAFMALRAQGAIPLRYTDATTSATPEVTNIRDVPDGGVLEVTTIVVGQVGANDCVYRKLSRTYERDGGTTQQIASDVGSAQYSSGGTLSTATGDIVLNGSTVQVEVTGEAATSITWRMYTSFTELIS